MIKMKKYILLVLFCFSILNCYSQENEEFIVGPEFDSVFQNMKEGEFKGTVNGVLFLETPEKPELILDFQAGYSELNIIPDVHEMYDYSYKKYTGQTTSGKTKVHYSTYSSANKFSIELLTGVYTIGVHDGASDMVVNGINYTYKREKNCEYLVVIFEKDLTLDNFRWLINKDIELKEANRIMKEIIVKANSVLVFIIKHHLDD
jgi:hypothetical protein